VRHVDIPTQRPAAGMRAASQTRRPPVLPSASHRQQATGKRRKILRLHAFRPSKRASSAVGCCKADWRSAIRRGAPSFTVLRLGQRRLERSRHPTGRCVGVDRMSSAPMLRIRVVRHRRLLLKHLHRRGRHRLRSEGFPKQRPTVVRGRIAAVGRAAIPARCFTQIEGGLVASLIQLSERGAGTSVLLAGR